MGIFLRVSDRVQTGRVLGDACDYSALGKRKLADILIKVTLCSRLYTEGVLSKIDRIHISFDNFIFTHLLLNLEGKELFLELTLQLIIKCLFIDEIGKDIILDQLLRQSTCTFGTAG